MVTFVTPGELEQLTRLAEDGNQALSSAVHKLIAQGLSSHATLGDDNS